MTLRDRVTALVGALPSEASITLPAATLRSWLEEDTTLVGATVADDATPIADLTADQVGAVLKRSGSTVRDWCREGRMPGAYLLRGKQWRIPRAAIAAFQRAEAGQPGATTSRPRARKKGPVDLGAWRKERAG